MAGRSSWSCLPGGLRGHSSSAEASRIPLLEEMNLRFALFTWRNVIVSQSVTCQRDGCAFLSVNQVRRSELRCLSVCRVGSFKNTFLLHLFSVCACVRTRENTRAHRRSQHRALWSSEDNFQASSGSWRVNPSSGVVSSVLTC